MNEVREYHSSCFLGGKVYVFGGQNIHKRLNSVEVLNTGALKRGWDLEKFPEVEARSLAIFCPVNNREILIMGGQG